VKKEKGEEESDERIVSHILHHGQHNRPLRVITCHII
jgi:hypothetical protein